MSDAPHSPIIILGAPRSGTSFLGKLLARHRMVQYMNEPRFVWRYGNDKRSDILQPPHATPKVRQYIRQKFAERLEASGKPVMVEKTPSNALRPGFCHVVYPEAKFIHIIRSGYDSVLSIESHWQNKTDGTQQVVAGRVSQRARELEWYRMPAYWQEILRRFAPKPIRQRLSRAPWGPRLPGIMQMGQDLTPRQIACLQWRACVEASCVFGQSMPEAQFLQIRLEDMSPILAQKVLDFCALPQDDDVDDYIQNWFDPQRTGKRHREMPQDIRTEVQQWIEPTMQWLEGLAPVQTQGADR